MRISRLPGLAVGQSFCTSALQDLLSAAAIWARRAARAASPSLPAGAVILPTGLGISTSAPSRKRSAPSTTTVSPGLRPVRT